MLCNCPSTVQIDEAVMRTRAASDDEPREAAARGPRCLTCCSQAVLTC